MNYRDFIQKKIAVADFFGFEVSDGELPEILKPHQRDIVKWALKGGCRAIFAKFGLGKTPMELALMKMIIDHEYRGVLFGDGFKPALVVAPLGVKQEFVRDAKRLFNMELPYVRTNTELDDMIGQYPYFITNYERIRDGQLDPNRFIMVSLDEASVLRSFGTKTYQEFLRLFQNVKYKFVATATPSPNDHRELINYAAFLGVMDTGEALTRFFERNPEKAGDLKLYPHKEREFWLWVASWAMFLDKPSDLGHSDDGYALPPLKVVWHRVATDDLNKIKRERDGQLNFFNDASRSLPDAARTKRETIPSRVAKMKEIIDAEPGKHFLLWHHLEAERKAICEAVPEAVAVYGEQDIEIREQSVIDFSDGKIQYLATKPELSGSGCNFQRHCSDAVFVGIDYRFNDHIQAIHRIYRYLQKSEVTIHIIYADSEDGIREVLLEKWKRHNELATVMSGINREYGLAREAIFSKMRRALGCDREEVRGTNFTAVRNDCVEEVASMPDNSADMILSSIPFSNHYEYSPNYNDFGHNSGNGAFFQQMDFLTPELLRILKPGRAAVIHVKDRILFGNVTGTGMPTVDPFHAETIFHYLKHGFQFFGMITIETDVVRENNQTYRLGWSEQCKDGSKMGVGCPEYLLLFRKLPSDTSKGYADLPVRKSKEEYSRGRWQIDARAKWNSSGNRLLTGEELAMMELETANDVFRARSEGTVYDYRGHVAVAESMEQRGRLPAIFETFRIPARSEWVWDDVVRMRTLNGEQTRKNLEKHICPLQFDIVERSIERWTNPGELVVDPFAGLMTVPYCAIRLGRRGCGIELNHGYFLNGVDYLRSAEQEVNAPTLFDAVSDSVN